jgi:hypothetical protein
MNGWYLPFVCFASLMFLLQAATKLLTLRRLTEATGVPYSFVLAHFRSPGSAEILASSSAALWAASLVQDALICLGMAAMLIGSYFVHRIHARRDACLLAYVDRYDHAR